METLRFLMISTHYPPRHLGGDARFVSYLARELSARGHEVQVFTNPAAYRLHRNCNNNSGDIDDNQIRVHQYTSGTSDLDTLLALSAGTWSKSQKSLDDLVGGIRPDVVHWHNTKGFIGRPSDCRGAVSLFTAHDYYMICPRSNLMRRPGIPCDNHTLCQSCLLGWGKPPQLWRIGKSRTVSLSEGLRVIAPSEFVASRLRQDGIPVHNVLRNFAPDTGYDKSGSRRETRDRLIFMGMLEIHKGPQTLLKGFIESLADHEFRIDFLGEGSLRKNLMKTVSERRLEDRVRILGFVSEEEMERTLADAAAVVIPSEWYENAPLVVIEAFSRGIPVIGSKIGGLTEMLREDYGCATFNPGDSKDIALRISETWRSRSNLPERGKRARNAYQTEFTPEVHLSRYLELVRSGRP